MAKYSESAIESRGPINRPEIQRDPIGNEGSQVDEACAKLDGTIDYLRRNWERLAAQLQPIRADEVVAEDIPHDASTPETPRSALATFITSRAAQVRGLADRIGHCTGMIDL